MLASLLLLVGLVGSPIVHADDDADPAARALELTRQAQARYQAGELEAAVDLLLQARELFDEEPLLEYNLARAYEGLGRLEEARDAYRRYLDAAPDAAERGMVESRIASLGDQIAERDRSVAERERLAAEREAALLAAREAQASGDGGPGPAPWVILSIGGAALAASVVTGVWALARRDDSLDQTTHLGRVETFEEAQTLATATNVLLIGGAALAVAGGIWLLVELL